MKDMDRRSVRYLVVYMVVLVVCSALPVNVSMAGAASDGDDTSYTFDRDNDNIDDDIGPASSFPMWTFVHMKEDTSSDEVRALIEDLGGSVGKAFRYIPVLSVRFDSYKDVQRASRLISVNVIEKDPEIVFTIDTSAKAVKAEVSDVYSPTTAHDLGYRGESMIVAILDLGIDNEHPTLRGSFVAGADFSKPDTAATPRDGSFDPDDTNGHGTGVASVLVGRGDGQGRYVGIAPKAKMIDLKLTTLNPAYGRNMVEAIEWCVDNKDTRWDDDNKGIDVISMSALAGNDPDGAVPQALEVVAENGIPFVQAAGNDGVQQGDIGYWWSDGVIIAGGSDDKRTVHRADDTYWEEATYGPRDSDGDSDPYDELKPDVIAPAINLSVAQYAEIGSAQGWQTVGGTSYATPHVSGIVTLMVEANPDLAELGGRNVVETIRELLHVSAEARGEPYDPELSDKYNQRYGYGIVDGYKAVKAALSYERPNRDPRIEVMTVDPLKVEPGGTVQVHVEATDPDGDPLRYELLAETGMVGGTAPDWTWTAPYDEGRYILTVEVRDGRGGKDLGSADVDVVEKVVNNGGEVNHPPEVVSFSSSKTILDPGETTTLEVRATDRDGDELAYTYKASRGEIKGQGAQVTFKAPSGEGTAKITVTVTDEHGDTDTSSIELRISDTMPKLPPVIESVELTPSSMVEGDTDVKVVLKVCVARTDNEIGEVVADLSSMGGPRKAVLKDDGRGPDVSKGDLEFTLLLEEVSGLAPGTYGLVVLCRDITGLEDTSDDVSLRVLEDTSKDQGDGEDLPFMDGINVLAVLLAVALTMAVARRGSG